MRGGIKNELNGTQILSIAENRVANSKVSRFDKQSIELESRFES